MPAGTARTATGVTVKIARDPALVRTVRLVAASVARRTGSDEEFVEEVRLAVGEGCALLLGEKPDISLEPVTVVITLNDRLEVEVFTEGLVDAYDSPDSDIDGVEPWALLRGLIQDFEVRQVGTTTTIAMSWPIG
jgi:anti-sigma regulatory factor (Ser/Thr protein kinase)